jgi:hypothetical protein
MMKRHKERESFDPKIFMPSAMSLFPSFISLSWFGRRLKHPITVYKIFIRKLLCQHNFSKAGLLPGSTKKAPFSGAFSQCTVRLYPCGYILMEMPDKYTFRVSRAGLA